MKKLDFNEMEMVNGGKSSSTCAGFGVGVAVLGIGVGVITGGVGVAVGALVGTWLGSYSYFGCLFVD